MELTIEEAIVFWTAFNQMDYDKLRSFPPGEATLVVDIGRKFREACTEGEKLIAGTIELAAAEKTLMARCVERPWTQMDAPFYLTLKEKLK